VGKNLGNAAQDQPEKGDVLRRKMEPKKKGEQPEEPSENRDGKKRLKTDTTELEERLQNGEERQFAWMVDHQNKKKREGQTDVLEKLDSHKLGGGQKLPSER